VPEIPDQPEDQKRDDEPMYVVVQFSAGATTRFRRTVYYAQGHGTVEEAEELAEQRRLIAKAGGRHRDRYEVFELVKLGERESAYRAGREDAARDIEESTAEDLDLPAWARPGGRPPPERLQEWAAYIGLRAWAASIARGTDRPTPRQGSGVVQPVEERQP
jgi:hypothetical protein